MLIFSRRIELFLLVLIEEFPDRGVDDSLMRLENYEDCLLVDEGRFSSSKSLSGFRPEIIICYESAIRLFKGN